MSVLTLRVHPQVASPKGLNIQIFVDLINTKYQQLPYRYTVTAQQKESKKKEKDTGPDLFAPPQLPATPSQRAPAPPTSYPAALLRPNVPPARHQKKISLLEIRLVSRLRHITPACTEFLRQLINSIILIKRPNFINSDSAVDGDDCGSTVTMKDAERERAAKL